MIDEGLLFYKNENLIIELLECICLILESEEMNEGT